MQVATIIAYFSNDSSFTKNLVTLPASAVANYYDEHVRICVCSCVCVCLSVCLSVCRSVRGHISGTTRAIFTNFSVHVACGSSSVLLRQGDKIPRRRAILGVVRAIQKH